MKSVDFEAWIQGSVDFSGGNPWIVCGFKHKSTEKHTKQEIHIYFSDFLHVEISGACPRVVYFPPSSS